MICLSQIAALTQIADPIPSEQSLRILAVSLSLERKYPYLCCHSGVGAMESSSPRCVIVNLHHLPLKNQSPKSHSAAATAAQATNWAAKTHSSFLSSNIFLVSAICCRL